MIKLAQIGGETMIEVYTDGASKGNPGKSGAGILIKNGKTTENYSIPLGVMSNHEAEFLAVLEALKICKEKFPNEIISIRTDSKIVVEAVEKNFVKNKKFQSYFKQIREESSIFPHFFIKWIPDKENSHADRLARQAISPDN